MKDNDELARLRARLVERLKPSHVEILGTDARIKTGNEIPKAVRKEIDRDGRSVSLEVIDRGESGIELEITVIRRESPP